jgi:hypothetical protein
MAGIRVEGSTSGNVAEVDTNLNLKVVLPTTATQAGYTQLAYVPSTAVAGRVPKVTTNGRLYIAPHHQLFDETFNAASTNWASKFGTVATTMTKAVVNGFMQLNSGAIVTTTTGISMYTNRVFALEEAAELRVKCEVKHSNATATNKQVDLGLGYYAFAAGQAAAMNEFIGFRWTTAGGYQAVVETTTGGAPTSQTVNLNGNVPLSDNVSREYEMVISDDQVDFFVAGAYQTTIVRDPATWGLLKSLALPWMYRQFHSGAASAAPVFNVGRLAVTRMCDDEIPFSQIKGGMSSLSYYWQPSITTGVVNTHNFPNSGTAPTAATGSNTASVLNTLSNMGGFYRMNGASIIATVHSNVLIAGFQNPALPTAAGAATSARNFLCKSITVSPLIVTTLLVGGTFTANWFATIGATALSLATTDADGTTAVAQKAPRLVPMPRVVQFASGAAVGTIETGMGDFTLNFDPPLPILPGEVLTVGLRIITASAAVTAGTLDGSVGVQGYWE